MIRKALAVTPKKCQIKREIKSEIRPEDVVIGRAREAQLLGESERLARRYAGQRHRGHAAFVLGESRNSNPYIVGTEAWCAWDNGWVESLDNAPEDAIRRRGHGDSLVPAHASRSGMTIR